MNFYLLEPEVAGNIDASKGDLSQQPPVIDQLRYTFDRWLGTEILTAYPPCFIVTDSLKTDLEAIGATGCLFDKVSTPTSEKFRWARDRGSIQGLTPRGRVPKFHWLKPTGVVLQDDIAQTGIEHLYNLCVSQRVWDVMQQHNMIDCLVEPMPTP